MNEPSLRPRGNPLSVVASLVIVLAGLRLAAPVVIPVLLALTIAVALQPLGRAMRRGKLPETLANVLSIVLVLAILAAVFALLVYAGTELGEAAPRLQSSTAALREDLIEWLRSRQLDPLAQSLAQVDVHERALSTMVGTVRGVASLVSMLLVVLVITTFIILEAAEAGPKLELLAKGTHRSKEDWLRVLTDVQRYLAVKTSMSALTGGAVWVLTTLSGIDGALLWGVVAFVLNFIPFIGSVVAGIPAVILALVDLGALNAVLVAVGYVAVNVGVSNFLEPRVMGRALGLAPVFVLLSVLLWGFILGPVGALLSVPLTMAVKIGLDRSERHGWVSRLMEPGSRLGKAGSSEP